MKIAMTQKFEEIISNYDALIVDLWGVIHDGTTLYPGVAETLRVLHELNKPVVFLSNAPRLSTKARKNLIALNIPDNHYLDIVTSGQVAHDLLAATPAQKKYYYLGPSKDEDVLDDLLNYKKVAEPQEADFILCTGYEFDGQPHEEIVPLLLQLLPLPLLCINPDMEVVKQDGSHFMCAGAVAAEYSRLGGRVTYIGKPFPDVYRVAKAMLGQGRFLAAGDNPATDIKGANDAGLDCLLVTGGVLAARYGSAIGEAEAREICGIAGVKPTYVLPGFRLAA
jgi:HAD superfamily hydrolase (TIGR01459 family)